MSDLTRAVIDALLPPGSAWRVKPGGHLDHLLQGIADNHAATLVDLRALGEARDPRTTPYLEELERDYGIDPNPQIPEAQRRAALATVMFSRDKLGTADDLQAALDASGFGDGGLGLHVYPNDPAVDPGMFAEGRMQSWCGGATSVCGYHDDGMPEGSWRGLAWSGALFCAVGYEQAGVWNGCATSPDGITWTVQAGIPDGSWYSVVWTGSVFVAVGTDVCATSPDGVTWTPRTIDAGAWRAVAWTGAQLCAVGFGPTNLCATSPTGTTWTTRAGMPAGVWQGIAWATGPNLFVACANGFPSANSIATSTDGVAWTVRTLSGRQWSAVTYSPTLGLWCVVASAIWSDYRNIATSPDGVTWTLRLPPALSTRWTAITWNPVAEMFVAIGDGPAVYCATSPDGITWTGRPSMVPENWTAIVWNGSQAVAVGQDGACASAEGILWEELLGGTLAFCSTLGDPGLWIVNGDVVTQAPAYECQCSDLVVGPSVCGYIPPEGGDKTAVCGRYVTLKYDVIPTLSPASPGSWPLVFLLAASAELDADGYIVSLTRGSIPQSRWALLVELVMRWKPTHSWCLALVDRT